MTNFHFTTVVSSGYVHKFLALQDSLSLHCNDYHLFALCVDDTAYRVLCSLELKNTTLFLAPDLEKGRLLQVKNNRNHHEYCWTLKPFFLKYIMQKYKDTGYYAHLDADLYFYSNPLQIVMEAPTASLFLTDHNFSAEFLTSYETSGRFNTGFVCCRNDDTAYAAVKWWLDKCFEKCSLVADAEKEIYGDQRYVEKWPLLFPNVHIVHSKGANVAQWNILGLKVEEKDSQVLVDNDVLVFFHFSGLEILEPDEYSLCTFYKVEDAPLNLIYMPYIKNLSKQISIVAEDFPDFNAGYANRMFAAKVHHVKIPIDN
ncbi:MAG: hypothetical protein ACM3ZR_04490 [Pseudomonadota bacterium]